MLLRNPVGMIFGFVLGILLCFAATGRAPDAPCKPQPYSAPFGGAR